MTSEAQERKIQEKIFKVANDILKNGGPISEVSKRTNISTSSIQRYLNDSRLELIMSKEEVELIHNILVNCKKEGLSKGGKISTQRNMPIRDSSGHFRGNKKR